MKYDPLPASLYIENRKRFVARMKPNTIALLSANELVANNADGYYRFVQNSNLLYLSGLDQEEVVLLLFPDAPNPKWKEMLFIRKTNEHIQTWEGWKYSKEEAKEASGVQTVRWYDELESALRGMVGHFDAVYLDINEHERNSLSTHTSGHKLAQMFTDQFPAHAIHRAAPILTSLRAIKAQPEIDALQVAMDITEHAFRRVLAFVRPGVTEYEIEAEITHEFLRRRATGHAYDPIIASGANACVLHYIENKAPCAAGDLLLMDFGAEYANYSADLSRTIPVSGSFTDRQKAVYNSVLRVQKAAIEMLVPGTLIEDYHKEVGQLMTKELVDLDLITMEEVKNQNPDLPAYKKYFMHGTSHFLGLDTHDVGNRYLPMEAGMIFTCEPGIYIPEENMGIRIENDILVTHDGPHDMMANIPREVEEIEALMQKVGV